MTDSWVRAWDASCCLRRCSIISSAKAPIVLRLRLEAVDDAVEGVLHQLGVELLRLDGAVSQRLVGLPDHVGELLGRLLYLCLCPLAVHTALPPVLPLLMRCFYPS